MPHSVFGSLLCSIIFHGTMEDTSSLQCMKSTYFVAPGPLNIYKFRIFTYDLYAIHFDVFFYVCGCASFLIHVCRPPKFWNPGFSIFGAFLYITNSFASFFTYLLSFSLCISSSLLHSRIFVWYLWWCFCYWLNSSLRCTFLKAAIV
jgi:hypothetical protein